MKHGEFSISAASVTVDGSVRHLSGDVVIESEGFRLRADKVEYNDATGELVTHGDAHITLK
jgi:lipopolysaccharide assembly outer membrane protein LptD (OstA)